MANSSCTPQIRIELIYEIFQNEILNLELSLTKPSRIGRIPTK